MPEKRLSSIWWMHPAIALGVPTIFVVLCAFVVSPESYNVYWRTGKFVDVTDVLMVLAAVAAFTLGVFAGSARRPGRDKEPGESWANRIPWSSVRTLFNLCFTLSLLGYIFWTIVGIRNGLTLGSVIDAIRGNDGATYEVHLHYLVPVAGVTSLTQFGIAAISFGIPLGIATGWRGVRWKIIMILGLGLFRALVNSERLGLIELALPCAISYIWHKSARTIGPTGWKRTFLQSMPILAALTLFIIFSASEYPRSWLNFYAARESSFLRFAGLRLVGYYVTAVNNAALFVHSLTPIGAPFYTALFARHFPVLNSVFDSVFPVTSSGEEMYTNLLSSFANPELNNPSGIYLPAFDYGTTGALIYWLLCGIACGYLYSGFLHFSPAGMFLYPVLFTSLVETPRILYWSDGRVFPPLFIIVISAVFVLNRPSQALSSGFARAS
jgi:hypothetical protein